MRALVAERMTADVTTNAEADTAAVAGGSVGEVAPTAVEENTSLLNNCSSTSKDKKMPPTPDEAEAANSPAAAASAEAAADAASETTPLAAADGVDPVKVTKFNILLDNTQFNS